LIRLLLVIAIVMVLVRLIQGPPSHLTQSEDDGFEMAAPARAIASAVGEWWRRAGRLVADYVIYPRLIRRGIPLLAVTSPGG
jgi:hypothetical protein